MAKDAIQELAPIVLIGGALWFFGKPLLGLVQQASNKANQVVGTGGSSSGGTSTTVATTQQPGQSAALVVGLQHIYGQGAAAPASGSYSRTYPQAGYIGTNGQATNTGTTYVVYVMNDGSYTLIPA